MDHANLVIALVVPFLSVFVAQQLAREHRQQDATIDLMLDVNRNMQRFRWACIAWRVNLGSKKPLIGYSPALEISASNGGLDTDILLLELRFADKANDVIHEIVYLTHVVDRYLGEVDVPKVSDAKTLAQDIDSQIASVRKAMKELWKSTQPRHIDLDK
jgi:hypothetical protein